MHEPSMNLSKSLHCDRRVKGILTIGGFEQFPISLVCLDIIMLMQRTRSLFVSHTALVLIRDCFQLCMGGLLPLFVFFHTCIMTSRINLPLAALPTVARKSPVFIQRSFHLHWKFFRQRW